MSHQKILNEQNKKYERRNEKKMASKLTKQFKQRVNQIKTRESIAIENNIASPRVVTVQINSNNVIKVVVSKGIRKDEVAEQIQDLVATGCINPTQKRISLSQFTDCCYDLLFNRQEKKDNVLESYFCTV